MSACQDLIVIVFPPAFGDRINGKLKHFSVLPLIDNSRRDHRQEIEKGNEWIVIKNNGDRGHKSNDRQEHLRENGIKRTGYAELTLHHLMDDIQAFLLFQTIERNTRQLIRDH